MVSNPVNVTPSMSTATVAATDDRWYTDCILYFGLKRAKCKTGKQWRAKKLGKTKVKSVKMELEKIYMTTLLDDYSAEKG